MAIQYPLPPTVDPARLPKHIGIIMDAGGRKNAGFRGVRVTPPVRAPFAQSRNTVKSGGSPA